MTDLKIVEKIQKLLSLSEKTGNQGEAEAAMAQAMRLMAKYNIDQQKLDVNAADPLAGYSSKLCVEYDQRMPTEANYILAIIREFFNVNTIVSKHARGSKIGGIYFVGKEDNIAVAKLVYNQLYIQFKRFWNDARVQNPSLQTTDKRNYYNGLYKGLMVRLAKEKKNIEDEMALVIVKDPNIADATTKFFGKTDTKAVAKYQRNEAVINKGFADSGKIQINQGIGSGAPSNDNKRFLLR